MPAPTRSGLSPRTVLPILAAALVLAVILTPQAATRQGDPRLTSYSTAPGGARGLFDVLRRLGWRAERRTSEFSGTLDSSATYAVLDPPIDLTAGETHRLLEAVRRGAGLLLVAGSRSPLADSLHIRPSSDGGRQVFARADSIDIATCRDSTVHGVIDWPGGAMYLLWLRFTAPPPANLLVFLTVARDALSAERTGRGRAPTPRAEPAVVGFELGRGRVVAVADPDLLRNDVIRTCKWNAGVTALRMTGWLAPLPSDRRIVFDEYHQGFGRRASVMRATGHALFATAPGRALSQALGAALILLAAGAVRPVLPVPRATIERRSPLEHVGALSRAYEQIGATRTAARRLVRGIVRRHRWSAGSDEDALRAIAERHSALAADVERLLDATHRPCTPTEFLDVGRAADHIERTLTPRANG